MKAASATRSRSAAMREPYAGPITSTRAASAGPWSLHPASPPLPGLVDARRA